ncbi:MAG: CHAP domain-containing protein, partial [Staphylococcus hyicus]
TPIREASSSDFKPFTETASGAAYPQGQCTWYVYNRMAQFGLHIGSHLGDAHDWDQHAANDGYSVRSIPSEHSAVVFEPGQLGADAYYGHVAFVEKVNSDGSIVISESNVKGLGVISYRTIDASDAESLTYIKGK